MIFRFWLTLGLLSSTACSKNIQNNKPITPHKINAQSAYTNDNSINLNSSPLHCPVTFKLKKSIRKNNDRYRIVILKNEGFNPDLQDACQGDLKNLWKDLERFKPKWQKAHSTSYIITNILTDNLDKFPVTKNEIKNYINSQAKLANLKSKLSQYDRTDLNDSLLLQKEIRFFLKTSVQSYLDTHHKPVINNTLDGTPFNIENYSAEKYQYCYKTFDRCEYLGELKSYNEDPKLDFEFFGVGFDGWKLIPKN